MQRATSLLAVAETHSPSKLLSIAPVWTSLLPLVVLLALTDVAQAQGRNGGLFGDPAPIKSVEEAVAFVDRPTGGFGNMSPFELQTHYRLAGLIRYAEYRYEAAHADAWLKLLGDEKRSLYGRQCAAYFLLDTHEEARKFILAQTKSADLRARYNAAEVLSFHVGRDPTKRWGVQRLIELLADGSLDGSGLAGSPPGNFPDGDRDDILATPLDSICWSFGFMKEKDAVPALISVLKRVPRTGGAAFAIGEIGDERGIPALMEVLKNNSGYEDREVTALAKFKHKEAVPLMLARLGHPRSTFSGMDSMETNKLLEALLEIGDRRAVEPIEKFLQGDCPEGSKRVARRVLVQFQSTDPVAGLLTLFDQENYEPERSDIIDALVARPDDRVTAKLADLARTSDSAFMRREAILGLSNIGDQKSLLILASLFEHTWPKDLKAEWGWKGLPDFTKYFPYLIHNRLKHATKQDFGRDAKKWTDWLNANPAAAERNEKASL